LRRLFGFWLLSLKGSQKTRKPFNLWVRRTTVNCEKTAQIVRIPKRFAPTKSLVSRNGKSVASLASGITFSIAPIKGSILLKESSLSLPRHLITEGTQSNMETTKQSIFVVN